MSAVSCYDALAAVGLSRLASPGARRHAAAASLPMFRKTANNYRRNRLIWRAANIPSDALVRRKTIEGDQWGIKVGEEDEKVTLWFLITGVDESNVKDAVKVNLPRGSDVLTIKKKKTTNADELLDVRLLLTRGYNREGIKVEKRKDDRGKVFLDVIIDQKTTQPREIDIKDYS